MCDQCCFQSLRSTNCECTSTRLETFLERTALDFPVFFVQENRTQVLINYGLIKYGTFISDPFARVSFVNQSQKTEKVMKTVCPTWDQTLIFESVSIYGNRNDVSANPPQVVVEVFDYDTLVSDYMYTRDMYMHPRTVCEILLCVLVRIGKLRVHGSSTSAANGEAGRRK